MELFKTRLKIELNIIIFIISLLCHITSFLLFLFNSWELPIIELFFNHFIILLTISLVLTILIYKYKMTTTIITFIIIKFLILEVIGYPLGNYIVLELFLFISVIIETGLLISTPINIILTVILNIFFVLSQNSVSAWNLNTQMVSVHDLIFIISFNLILSLIVIILSYQIKIKNEQLIKIYRLDSAISQLANANIGFQSYIKIIELDAIANERKRLSREIHDAVGYTLTNIIMLLEAANLLSDKDIKKQRSAILTAKDQAIAGLEETRYALRSLRKENIQRRHGLAAINQLITAFRNATGVSIKVEYGNLPAFTTEVIDIIIYRIIQEGITNAFRHGMATKITILFWVKDDYINLIIHDNGSGFSEISEGIGITGMRERMASINGILSLNNVLDGFELKAQIPWKKET